ncbi:unnamed protein product [Larinioides sclopetarius]|uniref:Uncharacterized protein n=1 Tax=Larinioides sclopetarius TaxID=280406 RepID=A0AAV2A043_9ARAC
MIHSLKKIMTFPRRMTLIGVSKTMKSEKMNTDPEGAKRKVLLK